MKHSLRNAMALTVALFASITAPAHAVVLSLTAADPVVSVGDPITIRIHATEFDSPTVLPIGAFTLPLLFDPSRVAFNSVAFGSMLDGGNPGDSLQFSTLGARSLALDEISFLSPDTVVAADGLLATIVFDSLAAGLAAFDLDLTDPFLVVGDGNGDPLPLRFSPAGAVVEIRAVPEPSVLSLFAVAILASLRLARRPAAVRT